MSLIEYKIGLHGEETLDKVELAENEDQLDMFEEYEEGDYE